MRRRGVRRGGRASLSSYESDRALASAALARTPAAPLPTTSAPEAVAREDCAEAASCRRRETAKPPLLRERASPARQSARLAATRGDIAGASRPAAAARSTSRASPASSHGSTWEARGEEGADLGKNNLLSV